MALAMPVMLTTAAKPSMNQASFFSKLTMLPDRSLQNTGRTVEACSKLSRLT